MAELASRRTAPDLDVERELWVAAGPGVMVAGLDEVGRGALAGPVVVGAVVIDAGCEAPPAGLRDSKQLRPAARRSLVPRIEAWARCTGLGAASAAEIDELGILTACGLAAWRALCLLPAWPDHIVLDGTIDLLARCVGPLGRRRPPVTCVVRGDQRCGSVAAASVLAKVARDAEMAELDGPFPAYGFSAHVGYGTAAHRAAMAAHGLTAEHRRSFRLGPARC